MSLISTIRNGSGPSAYRGCILAVFKPSPVILADWPHSRITGTVFLGPGAVVRVGTVA